MALKLDLDISFYNSGSKPVVRVPLGHAKIISVMSGNTKKKRVKIKTQKQSYGVLVYKERHVKVVTRPAHHWSYNYFNAVFICFDLVLGCYYQN
jgi:hypothetical protein